jgi:hypothetical protein
MTLRPSVSRIRPGPIGYYGLIRGANALGWVLAPSWGPLKENWFDVMPGREKACLFGRNHTNHYTPLTDAHLATVDDNGLSGDK